MEYLETLIIKKAFWIIGILIVLVFLFNYYFKKCKRLCLYYNKNKRNNEIIDTSFEIKSRIYSPTIYLSNGIFQSFAYELALFLYKPTNKFSYTAEFITHSDGGEIVLEWVNEIPTLWTNSKGIILLIPGITGSKSELYSRYIIDYGFSKGYRLAIFNHRGCSNYKLKTPKLYCASSTSDIEIAVKSIKEKLPDTPIYLFGMSLGANLSSLYAGERPNENDIKGIVNICNPFDLIICTLYQQQTFFGIFQKLLGKLLCRMFMKNINELRPLEKNYNVRLEDIILKIKSLKEYDEMFTSKMFNYTSAFDYYRKASCVNVISNIKVPTFILNSEDDPLIPMHAIPFKEIEKNSNIILATHPCSGHGGFFRGFSPSHWFCEPCFAFLDALRN